MQRSEPTVPALRSKGLPEPRLMSKARLHFSRGASGVKKSSSPLSVGQRLTQSRCSALEQEADALEPSLLTPGFFLWSARQTAPSNLTSSSQRLCPVLVSPSCPLHLLVSVACPPLTTPTAPTYPTLASITSAFVCPSIHPPHCCSYRDLSRTQFCSCVSLLKILHQIYTLLSF